MRVSKVREERLSVIAQPLDRALDLVFGLPFVHRAGGKQSLDVTRQFLDTIGTGTDTKILGRDVLELMRLVQDDARERRNDFTERVLPHRGVGAQQMVI